MRAERAHLPRGMDAALRHVLDRLYRESRANLVAAGLDVQLRTQNAADALAESPDGAYDFVFLDAERPAYVAYWPQLVRTLAPRGLLAVDNAVSHEHELLAFTALVEADDRVTSALVPVGAGLRLAVRA